MFNSILPRCIFFLVLSSAISLEMFNASSTEISTEPEANITHSETYPSSTRRTTTIATSTTLRPETKPTTQLTTSSWLSTTTIQPVVTSSTSATNHTLVPDAPDGPKPSSPQSASWFAITSIVVVSICIIAAGLGGTILYNQRRKRLQSKVNQSTTRLDQRHRDQPRDHRTSNVDVNQLLFNEDF